MEREQESPAVMVMTGMLLLLLLDALPNERGAQSDVSTNGMWAGAGLKGGLTINAV
jgi:hypothetical protein